MADADFQQPQLAERLGLAVETGWEDVLRNEVPLAEAVVQSCQDHLALLPLRATTRDASVLVDSLRSSTNLRVLRHHYHMVLVDLGPVLDERAAVPALKLAQRSGIDSALLVRDARTTTDDDLRAAVASFAGVGVPAIGIVETFATSVAA
jgi:Mrp family chromosome partitioning ATPase